MGDVQPLLVAIARFLAEDVKSGTTGTRAATRAELCAACQSLALASLADSVRQYLVGDEEEHPHLQLVENPEPETRDELRERLDCLKTQFDELSEAHDRLLRETHGVQSQ